MKKTLTFIVLIVACTLTGTVFSQEKKSKEIKKEVIMEEEDGVKTLTITTTSNGQKSEEKYTGEEADAKLAEMMEGRGESDEIKKEVKMEEVNGEKKLTIITSRKGKIREEVYIGEEAEAKMKELEKGEKSSDGNVKIVKKTTEKSIEK